MILSRSLIYFVLMSLTVVSHGLTIAILGRFLGTRFSDRVATHWGRLNISLQRWICCLRVHIEGAEHLPQGGAILMAKHQSTWETIALRGLLAPHQSWVLKQELLKIPFFGWALGFCRAIPIDRKAGRKAVLQVVKEGKRALDDGRVVVIFPEGTRTAPGERRRYGIGGAILAEKSGYPVVPVAHNAGVYWKRRGVKKYPGTIEVRVGAPIASTGKKAQQIIAEVEDWIEGEVEKLPSQLPR
ncbi:lysophospholipid acyltransferase family protein [endosymbiont of unidentified scaly snail isolate Monju]|uniref:lysophospholipid acyltransferase family protein n=1 Tax=endosymbiont of unidentified scaly snail isolate Monju TaxID=1248727 RepID=UPI0003891DAB|nr:lysophospholipid acyltransferase family protein [endosymbiont of unidentified scaly snail isolate Monju]BAN68001.1 1-acyl-sn-glycerol-3-phosphate acyltransferase [endosymbiont of unidentified scaly snail isolate Monju]